MNRSGLAVSAALLLGCSSPDIKDLGRGDGGPGGGAGGGDGPIGSGSGQFMLKHDGSTDLVRPDGGRSLTANDASCATSMVRADRIPLDLYIMFDASYSMLEMTAARTTKWDAVRMAMTSFFNDMASAGLNIGLQYFPIVRAGVPEECTMDGQCGMYGPCSRIKVCARSRLRCDTDAECAKNDTCTLVGACKVTGQLCIPAGAYCGSVANPCEALSGYCKARDLCEVPPYSMPAVPFGTLPGAAPALTMSLQQKRPDGLTPTAPALQGALEQARARLRQDPNRRVAVVFATDGLPVECTPTDIAGISAIAQTAARGTPPINTFVIGVFANTPEEQMAATTNLGAIAQAGGTGKAFIINTDQNVTQTFQMSLNQIRAQALPCEFKIPPPTMGAIDYGKVNVQFMSASTNQTVMIGNVRDRSTCDPMRGGWYYDVNPATGKPTLIIACDATCNQLRADPGGGKVDVVYGCATVQID